MGIIPKSSVPEYKDFKDLRALYTSMIGAVTLAG